MTSLELPKLMSKKEVAGLFGVSVRTVERWLKDGELDEVGRGYFGKSLRFHGADLEKLIEKRTFRVGA